MINSSSSKKEKKKNIISLGAGCFLTHNTERVTKHSKSAQASNHCTIVCVCVYEPVHFLCWNYLWTHSLPSFQSFFDLFLFQRLLINHALLRDRAWWGLSFAAVVAYIHTQSTEISFPAACLRGHPGSLVLMYCSTHHTVYTSVYWAH